jgi:hypothetical protein
MKKHNLNLINKKHSERVLENNIELFSQTEWNWVSIYQVLSEEFIEKHLNKLDLFYVSAFQKLSEKFIEKHSDKLNWDNISKFQKLSEQFIKKHINKINIEVLMINEKNI